MNRKAAFLMIVVLVAMPVVVYADGTPDGGTTYKAKCAMCHGPDGAGQTPTGKSMKVRDLRSDDVQKMSDVDLMKIIADGKGKMPAYKTKLSADEIQALLTFVRQLKK